MTLHNGSVDLIHPIGNQLGSNERGTLSDPLWTVEDVADYLKLQPETIRSMARRGELPALKIGKVWRFQRQAIHEMLVNMY
jgi:excisionase family DNA binding protein